MANIKMKLHYPYTVNVSSGGLCVIAFGIVLLISGTVYTSDINEVSNPAQAIAEPSTAPEESAQQLHPKTNHARTSGDAANPKNGTRRRNGRLYGAGNSASSPVIEAGVSSHPTQSLVDHYSIAYGTASGTDTASAQQVTGTQAASDASSFASFGEQIPGITTGTQASTGSSNTPSTSSMLGNAAARQHMAAGVYDYSGSPTHHIPNDYASYLSPSTNSMSYANNHQLQASNYANTYHAAMSQQYPYSASSGYHKHANSLDSSPYNSGHYAATDSAHGFGFGSSRHSPASFDKNFLASSSMWSPSSGSHHLSNIKTTLSHWFGGFGLTEVLCGLVALSIGLLILGAPFFLIYLALMGNFSGSGTLSLTNPHGAPAAGAATTVNGRRKRIALMETIGQLASNQSLAGLEQINADSVIRNLSPLVDIDNVIAVVKRISDGLERHTTSRKAKSADGKVSKTENPDGTKV